MARKCSSQHLVTKEKNMKKSFNWANPRSTWFLMLRWLEAGLLLFVGLSGCRTNPSTGITPNVITSTLTETSSPTRTSQLLKTFPTPSPLYMFTQNPAEVTPIADSELTTKWLKGIPCAPPCWEGVIPGKTTGLEAAKIWSANPLFKWVSIGELRLDRLYFVTNTSNSIQGEVPFYLSNPPGDHQAPISLIRVEAFNRVKLSELIQAFGPPSHVIAEIADIQGDSSWILYIIWMSKGFSISHIGLLPAPRIDENLTLLNGTYFSPGLEGFQKTDMIMGPYGPFHLYPWHGYDNFKGYYVVPTPTP
jgi:hypothetical protein